MEPASHNSFAHSTVRGSVPDSSRVALTRCAGKCHSGPSPSRSYNSSRSISNFTDHTLPPGRPRGPEGPAFASRRFRAAVPDLKVTVEKMIVAGDYVTVHMNFTGHFTGRFGQTQGKGQPVPFIATDLVKIENSRITDNWHIEDNLMLLQEMGVAKAD
jgi:predicted ester cyclase